MNWRHKGNVRATDKLVNFTIQAFGFEDERQKKPPLLPEEQAMLERFLGTKIGVPDAIKELSRTSTDDDEAKYEDQNEEDDKDEDDHDPDWEPAP